MRIFKAGSLDVYEDERGKIANMLPEGVNIKSVMYITGKAGAVRGQHWHSKDIHYCYVIEGEIEYTSREHDTGEVKRVLLEPGYMVANDTNDVHKFVFKTDGIFIAMATEPRNQQAYEKDTHRVDF